MHTGCSGKDAHCKTRDGSGEPSVEIERLPGSGEGQAPTLVVDSLGASLCGARSGEGLRAGSATVIGSRTQCRPVGAAELASARARRVRDM